MSLARLANELLDAIFTEVHATADLKACSLAARFLVDPSQRRLFRSLSLFSNRLRPGARGKVENTHDPATLSPRLSSYVTELRVYLDSAARQFATLISVLRKPGSLTRLKLVAVGLSRWHEIPIETQLFRRDICGYLYSLSLNGIADVPAAFIQHAASSLQALSLIDITMPLYNSVIAHGASSTALKDLVILAKGDNFESALDAGIEKHLRALRKLESYLGGAYEARREQFSRTSNFHTTLEHLELFLTYPLPSLLLPTLPVLRFMKLQFEFHGTHLPDELDALFISLPITAPLPAGPRRLAAPPGGPLLEEQPGLAEVWLRGVHGPKACWRSRGGHAHVLYIPGGSKRYVIVLDDGIVLMPQRPRVLLFHSALELIQGLPRLADVPCSHTTEQGDLSFLALPYANIGFDLGVHVPKLRRTRIWMNPETDLSSVWTRRALHTWQSSGNTAALRLRILEHGKRGERNCVNF
ncbi:hypothetical protein FB451DRAFT_1486515 [Mycena latifolia]|nr:hypothetical protein FB451DRAFT_1486515 [Mycena latifolia]